MCVCYHGHFNFDLVVEPAPKVKLAEEVMAKEESAKARKLRKATALAEMKTKIVKAPKEKAVKAPKKKVVKENVPKAPALHPLYLMMVVEAIGSLKEQTGSSQQAIAKYLEDQYMTGLPSNFKKMLTNQSQNLTKSGKLVKVKNSYKLSDVLKKPAKVVKASSALFVKKLAITSQVKSKSIRVVGTKSKAGGAKVTKADAKASMVAKPKAVGKVSASIAKKAKVATSPAKKAAQAIKKAKAVALKKIAPAAAAKKHVARKKPPTMRKMVTAPNKGPKSVKANVMKPTANATLAQAVAK